MKIAFVYTKITGRCRLESVELDILGQCKECIYISIEEEKLKELKEQIKKISETKTARNDQDFGRF